MKIAFVINDIHTEKHNFTTIRLARRATMKGHQVYLVGLGDFTYQADESISGLAYAPSKNDHEGDEEFLADLLSSEPQQVPLSSSGIDVMLLRSDPADELDKRPWAPTSGLLFAQLAARSGVIVLNDPRHLTDAANKTYFQQYPETVRPRTCISRSSEEIKRFVEQQAGQAVIKPLQGSGGRGVFIINQEASPNVNQMIEATVREGYAIVQEYLPRAKEGDLRLLTLNGKPLVVDGTYACLHRFSSTDDGRSNISAG